MLCSWHVLTSTAGNPLPSLPLDQKPQVISFFFIRNMNALLHTNHSALLLFRKMTASLPPKTELQKLQQPTCDLCRQTTLSVSHCSGLELMFTACKVYRLPSGIVFEPEKLYRNYYWSASKFGASLWLYSTHMHSKRNKGWVQPLVWALFLKGQEKAMHEPKALILNSLFKVPFQC